MIEQQRSASGLGGEYAELNMATVEDLRSPMENMTLSTDNYGSASAGYHSVSESPSSGDQSKQDATSGYLNDYTDFETSLCRNGRRRHSVDTVDTNLTLDQDVSYLDRFNQLVELERTPWGEDEVLHVLREGRTKNFSGHITVEMMQRLCTLLQRPLVRISQEAQRLSSTFCKCSKEEVHTAMKIVLSRSLSESCLQACHKAVALYAMSADSFKQSKRSRCGLKFSVGKFHRWMIDANVAQVIHEYAAIYVTACMENLLEEIVLIALGKEKLGSKVLSVEVLESSIASHAELWGLLQPHAHLICGRNSAGIVSLPNSLDLAQTSSRSGDSSRVKGRKESSEGSVVKNVEQSLLATCVGSLSELGDLVSRALHHWQKRWPSCSSSSNRGQVLSWSHSALHTLYYYMRCSQLEQADNPNMLPPSVQLGVERPYTVQPPLVEWLRVVTAHTEHRRSLVVDSDDVRQAARLLLPGVDCSPRQHRLEESACVSHLLAADTYATRIKQDLGLQMLATGRVDILPHALALLGEDGVNTRNEKGLSPLMMACIRGDEAAVQLLLDAGANIDLPVPTDSQQYPCVHAETKHWTALTFATVHGYLAIVQLLLEQGASVEGSIKAGEENYSETPLQLAAASGHYELVSLLLNKGADPYLNTVHKNTISYTYSRGSYSAFALAAAHGHRNVLRKLLQQPAIHSQDILSLEEILAEGNTDTFKCRHAVKKPIPIKQDLAQQDICETSSGENIYVTIDEVFYEDSKLCSHWGKMPSIRNLNKQQKLCLQEALYHAAENGYLDIALELRNLGVAWSLHSWSECLSAAFNLRRKTLVSSLLKDFATGRQEEFNSDFIQNTLPLMFDTFRKSKNDTSCAQLAEIFSGIYGQDVIPNIKLLQQPTTARIDPRFVNNPELSDVQFLIDGKIFYAHKIILVNASQRFRAMLSNKFCEGSQACIELNDVRYQTFEQIMTYLYNGGSDGSHLELSEVLELIGAANFFLLEGLQRHCEMLLSRLLVMDNCVAIYRHAKLYHASELAAFCEGYFLQHLPSLTSSSESFRRLAFSSRLQTYGLLPGLLNTLARRMEYRLRSKNKTSGRSSKTPI